MIRTDLREALRGIDLCRDLDDALLTVLAADVRLVTVARGQVLYRQGEPAEGLYGLLQGSLRLRRETAEGAEVLAEIEPGGHAGETALLTGRPQPATLHARRDSLVLCLSPAAFRRLVERHSAIGLALARILARRESGIGPRTAGGDLRRLAVLPLGPGVDDERFVADLAKGFRRQGDRVMAVRPAGLPPSLQAAAQEDDGAGGLSAWFDRIGREHEILILVCARETPRWNRHCMRQADAVLVLAQAEDAPSAPSEELLPPGMPSELVLLRAAEGPPRGTAAWLDSGTYRRHHQVRRAVAADTWRVARLLRGRGIGLALSGGGRRCTAHIGVFKALAASCIQPDIIAGSSGGAMLGAMRALDMDPAAMLDHVRIIGRAPFYRDLGPPLVSLLGERTLNRVLQGYFGEACIEDTPLPLLPVCAGLSDGEVVVPARGPLWRAIRASCAAPAIFPPVSWEGRLLVDGGVVNNLPADLLAPGCAGGRIMAVDLGVVPDLPAAPERLAGTTGWSLLWRRWRGRPRPPSLLDILRQAGGLASTAHLSRSLRHVDLLIRPDLDETARSGDPLAAMVEAGYRATMVALETSSAGRRAETTT